jgi:hypothetical protein
MTGKVIQGSFLSGQPKSPNQPKIAPTGRWTTSVVTQKMTSAQAPVRVAARPAGPPVSALAAHNATVQGVLPSILKTLVCSAETKPLSNWRMKSKGSSAHKKKN